MVRLARVLPSIRPSAITLTGLARTLLCCRPDGASVSWPFKIPIPAAALAYVWKCTTWPFSKLAAGREKDLAFVSALLRHRLANTTTIEERLALTALDEARRQLCIDRLKRLQASA